MAKKVASRKKTPPRPSSESTIYGALKPQLDQIKELVLGFFATIQALKPIYGGKASSLGIFLYLQKIKVELKREFSSDIKNLEIELARLEERLDALQNELDLTRRISRLEGKYDFLIEEQLNPKFSLSPIEEGEGYEALPDAGERNEEG